MWIRWTGGEWKLPPDTLVHVRFYGPPELCDEHMDPVPASYWGTNSKEPSNWRGPSARIDEYRVYDHTTTPTTAPRDPRL